MIKMDDKVFELDSVQLNKILGKMEEMNLNLIEINRKLKDNKEFKLTLFEKLKLRLFRYKVWFSGLFKAN